MYKPTRGQMTFFDEPIAFAGAKLSPDNRWFKVAPLISCGLLDRKYSEQFGSNKTGYPAKAARMALGSHIIKRSSGSPMRRQWNISRRAVTFWKSQNHAITGAQRFWPDNITWAVVRALSQSNHS